MQANRILEVGTAYGYATLWMALAQPSVGRIWTIDSEAARTDVARSYFRRAAEDDYIEVFNTPALELLENFPHRNLDIVFVAANPREYDKYLDATLPMLKLSGLAIFNDAAGGARLYRAFSRASRARLDDAAARHRHRRPPAMTGSVEFKHAMRHVPTGVTVVTTLQRRRTARHHRQRLCERLARASVAFDLHQSRGSQLSLHFELEGYFASTSSRAISARSPSISPARCASGSSSRSAIRSTRPARRCLTARSRTSTASSRTSISSARTRFLIGHVLSCSARAGSPLGYFNGGFHDFGIHVD